MEDDDLVQCMIQQSDEIDVLSSMYSPEELLMGKRDENGLLYTHTIVYKTIIGNGVIEATFHVPSLYPVKERITVMVRTGNLVDERRLNTLIRDWIEKRPLGEVILLDVFTWINENIQVEVKEAPGTPNLPVPVVISYARYYIHSHHLYSVQKREDLVKKAKLLGLNGFSTPGKPAVIIIEGAEEDCKSYYAEVKSWTWQKLTLRATETKLSAADLKFPPFKELVLPSKDNKHVQTKNVKEILSDYGLDSFFNVIYNI